MTAPRGCPFCGKTPDRIYSTEYGQEYSCPDNHTEWIAEEEWNCRADDLITITPLGAAMLEGKKNG